MENYDSILQDESNHCMTNVNSTSDHSYKEVGETLTVHDFKGKLITRWDEVCEIEFTKNGAKSLVIAKWEDYQDVLDAYKNWHQEKLSYYEKGKYIKYGDPKWVMRKEEVE